MSWKSPSPGRAEKGRKSWIKHHRLFLVEIDTIDSPLSPYWACHLCDAKGQPEFFAAAATSSAADHLRKYVNVSVTSRARASLTDAGSTGLLRAVKQLVQIRQPTDLNGPSDDACSIALCHAPESRRFEN
ncbi:hypothetical protein Focb16_v005828 [Fusarium oxysporum f. sp. cubense]|uniref:Uncharacterized protein n=1 Tax=Fusarium oxysporum f. sp. cubense TaxID=61366 RepID=A0A559LLM1_FUSOC|nr:hypothetical protein Focb16_v005828 [Fusarium oxysporum f. sp. cubense]